MPVVLQEPQDGSDAPAYEVPVHRNALVERLKSVVISSRSLLLKTHGPVLPRIELVLPYRLFDWNTQEVEIRARESLPASYPLILRSWERNYPWWENPFAGPANPDVWISKCQELPGHPLMPHHIRWVDDDSDLSQLADHLAKEQVWGLFAPCPRGGRGKASQQILVAALSGGLPCVIWPLVEALDCEDQRHALLHWLCAFALQELPERLHRVRRNDHPEWQQLAVLWDDPRHPLPDRDYSALTTD